MRQHAIATSQQLVPQGTRLLYASVCGRR